MKTPRRPFLAALALSVAVFAGDAVAGKSDKYGRQVITYEAPIDDAGTWTQSAPMPVSGSVTSTPSTWTVNSGACIAASVSAATGGEDGGRLRSADGGIAAASTLYRCFNPSGSTGDICLRSNSTTPFACSASALAMAVAPGGEAWTMLTDPVMVSSSSGAASLICCPVTY